KLLGLFIGLPFIVLSATSPLLQVWWAQLEQGEIPYRLYALSNLASLLALGLYPTLIEPHLTLHAQRVLWSCGFLVFVVVAGRLARLHYHAAPVPQAIAQEDELAEPAPLNHKLFWVLLPMAASMQLSAVTVHLTAN